jgi:hypothetical protein
MFMDVYHFVQKASASERVVQLLFERLTPFDVDPRRIGQKIVPFFVRNLV